MSIEENLNGTHKRDEEQKESDRVFIASKMIRSVPVREIMDLLEDHNKALGLEYKDGSSRLSRQQIWNDTKIILKQWRAEREEFLDDRMDFELKKIDAIEEALWEAWEKSKEGKRKTRIDGGVVDSSGKSLGGNILDRTLESSPGDSKYMERIQWCIDKRLEILGFKVNLNVNIKGKRVKGAGKIRVTYNGFNEN